MAKDSHASRPNVWFLPVVLTAVAFAGCQSAAVGTAAGSDRAFDPVAEAEVLMALQREWSARLAAGDVDWIMDLHAEDAWQLPPNAAPVSGHDALRSVWEGMAWTEGLEISWEPTLARVAASGDMAYDIGRATIAGPGGRVEAKYLVVWVRREGRWKVAADMFSFNEPPP